MALTHAGVCGWTTIRSSTIPGGAGAGRERAAFEIGIGAEVMVTDNLSVRAEALAFGQLGPVPNGNNIGRHQRLA